MIVNDDWDGSENFLDGRSIPPHDFCTAQQIITSKSAYYETTTI